MTETEGDKVSFDTERPRWSPRVSRYKIALLYHTDAKGIRDEDLVNDVGYAFYARILDIMTCTEAHRGLVTCPKCEGRIECRHRKDEILECPGCDWKMPWKEYHKSYRKKGLLAGGMEPYFREFAKGWPQARTYAEKIVLIDTVIHRYHWELQGDPGRPGAVNLIGGRLDEVAAFLTELTHGDESSQGLEQNRARWLQNLRHGKWGQEDKAKLVEAHRWESQGKFEDEAAR